MRIGDLSRQSGVAVATLKYYLREALLHPGVMTAVNQADYDQSHLRRVALVRALLEAGQLRIADVRQVVAAVEAEDVTIHQAFGIAQDAMVPDRDRSSADYVAARAEVDRFVARHRLRIRPEASVNAILADALVLIRAFDFCGPGASVADGAALLDPLVAAAIEQATAEVALVPEGATRAEQLVFTVIGTIAFELASSAVRRMALEHASAARFEPDPDPTPTPERTAEGAKPAP